MKCETREIAYKQADAERKRYSEQIDELIIERDEWKAKAERMDAHRDANETCPDGNETCPSDDLPPENDVSADGDGANGANSAQDSREKLEADLKTHLYEFGGYCFSSREGHTDNVDTFFDDFVFLLDRQAAITRREALCQPDEQRERIDELQRELGYYTTAYRRAVRERDEAKAECGVCDAVIEDAEEIAGLEAERDYWREQVQLCLDAAYPPNHSPEMAYSPCVMGYPDRDGYTTPSTLVCAVIDGMRDELADIARLVLSWPSQARDGDEGME